MEGEGARKEVEVWMNGRERNSRGSGGVKAEGVRGAGEANSYLVISGWVKREKVGEGMDESKRKKLNELEEKECQRGGSWVKRGSGEVDEREETRELREDGVEEWSSR